MSLDKGLQALEELEQQILQENDEAKKAELTRSKGSVVSGDIYEFKCL